MRAIFGTLTELEDLFSNLKIIAVLLFFFRRIIRRQKFFITNSRAENPAA
jgi:hypothetical protein